MDDHVRGFSDRGLIRDCIPQRLWFDDELMAAAEKLFNKAVDVGYEICRTDSKRALDGLSLPSSDVEEADQPHQPPRLALAPIVPSTEDPRKVFLRDLGIANRYVNRLIDAKFITVADVLSASDEDIRVEARTFGKNGLDALDAALAARGFVRDVRKGETEG